MRLLMEMINLKKNSHKLCSQKKRGGQRDKKWRDLVTPSSRFLSKYDGIQIGAVRKRFFFIFWFVYKDPTGSEATNLTNGEYQKPWPMCRAVGCVGSEINDRRSNAWVTGGYILFLNFEPDFTQGLQPTALILFITVNHILINYLNS
jgi:hypothetical protein